jgi:hypothetical protein
VCLSATCGFCHRIVVSQTDKRINI